MDSFERSPAGAFVKSPAGARGPSVRLFQPLPSDSIRFLEQRANFVLGDFLETVVIQESSMNASVVFCKEGVIRLLRHWLQPGISETQSSANLFLGVISQFGYSERTPEDTQASHPGWLYLPSGGIDTDDNLYFPYNPDVRARRNVSVSAVGNIVTLRIRLAFGDDVSSPGTFHPAKGLAFLYRTAVLSSPQTFIIATALFDEPLVPQVGTITALWTYVDYELDVEIL